jgi:hypothetical protein
VKRVERYPVVWGAIVVVLLVALAGTLIAYVHANTTASCLNNVLGTRDRLGQLDHRNEAQKIADQKAAVKDQAAGVRLILTGDPAQGQRGALLYQRGVNEFVESLARWQARDAQINAERVKSPLGFC